MTLLNFFNIWGRMTSFSVVSCRSSHRRRSTKNDVLGNFAKFTGKRQFQSPFFNKVGGLRPATLLKRPWHWCFPVDFAKYLKNTFFAEHPRMIAFVAGVILARASLRITYGARIKHHTL